MYSKAGSCFQSEESTTRGLSHGMGIALVHLQFLMYILMATFEVLQCSEWKEN